MLFFLVRLVFFTYQLKSGMSSATAFGLLQSLPSIRGSKTKIDCWFNVQKQPVLDSRHALLAKKPHLDTRFWSHQNDRKSSGCGSGSSADSKKKGSCRLAFLMRCSLLLHHHHFHQLNGLVLSQSLWINVEG